MRDVFGILKTGDTFALASLFLGSSYKVICELPKTTTIYLYRKIAYLFGEVLSPVFLSFSVHLYFMLPSQPEGGLAMYRSALVQNKHLAQLAKVNHRHV